MNPENWIDPQQPAPGPPPQTLWRFLRWAVSGAGRVMLVGAAVSAFAGTLEVMTALLLGWVIDAALAGPPETFFAGNLPLLLGMVAFFLLLRPLVLGLSGMMQTVVVAPALNMLVLTRLHRHVLGQSVSYFDDDFAGRIAQKQIQAAGALTDLVVDFLQTVAFALASLIGSVIVALTIDPRAALVLALWSLAYVLLIRHFIPRVRARSKARAAARAMVTGQVVDTITNIKTVKLFAHDAHEDRAAIDAMAGYRARAVHFGWLAAGFRFWLMALGGLLPLLLVGLTLMFWAEGSATPGAVVATGAISLRLAQMTGWVSFTLMAMYAHLGEVEDAVTTLSPAHQLTDAPDAIALPADSGAVRGEIRFEAVSFRYDGGPGGLDQVSLTVAPGEKLGVVGASGAGKSTLLALLLRLYDAEAGRVLVAGHDVRRLTQASLRQAISMVTQETAMFNRAALDNIRYGRPEASDADVIAAAKQAAAHDFITDLRDHQGREGYRAHLGERGVKLSGGQRQRIAIARAILKDAPILVLDEATSALDSEVEAQIQAALDQIMADKTVIAIAHRLSTLAQMDRLIVLDQGRIVETGSHAALLDQGGLYARYWQRQSGGFLAPSTLGAAE